MMKLSQGTGKAFTANGEKWLNFKGFAGSNPASKTPCEERCSQQYLISTQKWLNQKHLGGIRDWMPQCKEERHMQQTFYRKNTKRGAVK